MAYKNDKEFIDIEEIYNYADYNPDKEKCKSCGGKMYVDLTENFIACVDCGKELK